MKVHTIASLATAFLVISMLAGCRMHEKVTMSDTSKDSLHPTGASPAHMPSQVDTAMKHATVDSNAIAHPPSDLPPIATPIASEKLAQFLPTMDGYIAGELQHEMKIQKNFSSSVVSRTYTKGDIKTTIEIDDYAYVPTLYEPFTKFKDAYLDDDNVERTETTTIKGYHAVQTWEKQSHGAQITLFPGRRYVVKVTSDGIPNIDAARTIVESMNLKGLEALQ